MTDTEMCFKTLILQHDNINNDDDIFIIYSFSDF